MQDLKSIHEKEVSKRFMELYNLYTKRNLIFEKLGNPQNKEPDCICNNNTALELVGVYDNEYQGEKLWNEARGKKESYQPYNPKLDSHKNLREEIIRKLEKLNVGHYDGFSGKIILLCVFQSPLVSDEDIEQYTEKQPSFKKHGTVFEKHFDEIWLHWKSTNGEWKIKRYTY